MHSASHVPFLVVVRSRRSNNREREVGRLRFPARADTGFRSISCTNEHVFLVDPDATASFQDFFAENADDGQLTLDSARSYLSSGELRMYNFHRVFGPSATNLEVYELTTAPLVRAVRDGYNGTCFAYGMTGAGKTYTMLGSPAQRGLSGLAAEDLFMPCESDTPSEFSSIPTVTASYLEIYNEKLRDLLMDIEQPRTSIKELEIIEDAEKGIIVPGVIDVPVYCARDLELLLDRGNENRTMASTVSNVASSRSHAILTLTVRRRHAAPNDQHAKLTALQGKLCLVDLAGSERASVEFTKDKQERRLEGANINRSLLALGNCITTLGNLGHKSNLSVGFKGNTAPIANVHIPYRDSKLTRLLQESLGGNTRTVMIGCVSESCVCFEETLSTLKYASRAKTITRQVHRNTVTDTSTSEAERGNLSELVVKLRDDVRCLRTQLTVAESTNRKLGLVPANVSRELSSQRAPSQNRPLWDPARAEKSETDLQLEMVQKLRAQLNELDMNRLQARQARAPKQILSPAPQEKRAAGSRRFDPERQIDEFLFH